MAATRPPAADVATPLVPLLLQAFDRQIDWCREPAPFCACVLQAGRDWLTQDQAAHDAFAAVAEDPMAAALPLRWLGALHHLALRGLEPWVSLWPGFAHSRLADDDELAAAVRAAWSRQRSDMDAALARPPQTNEVQRSAVLLPGLLHVAAATGLPLSLVEIGSSAGLNLWCERFAYRYEAAALPGEPSGHGPDSPGWNWGAENSPLTMHIDWRGGRPPSALRAASLVVARRAGCDAHPIALAQPDEALRLMSFIWPDQPERLERLRAAIQAAVGWMRDEGVAVQASQAAPFVAAALNRRNDGETTVLMHSVVWQYLGEAQQSAIEAAIRAAAARASDHRPLAWLRMEPSDGSGRTELRCQLWPGGTDRLLARTHPHGTWIEWLGATEGERAGS